MKNNVLFTVGIEELKTSQMNSKRLHILEKVAIDALHQ